MLRLFSLTSARIISIGVREKSPVLPTTVTTHMTQRINFITNNIRHVVTTFQTVKETSIGMPSYSIIERGSRNAANYKMYLTSEKGVVSPFHDIPLYANEDKTVLNMVVEIPRWTNAKMEISKEEQLNPILQDVKKGRLRYVANVFPTHGYIWNYGALPQTWEDPTHEEPETNTKGDKDPLDICEIGSTIHACGSVIQVKVLGIMCLIDEGETDWKVIVIDVNDPRAEKLNDIEDVNTHCPGLLKATYDWFRIYKIPDGKPENTFAFDGKAKDKEYAMRVIRDTHRQWQSLLQNQVTDADISCNNTSVCGSPYKITYADAKDIVNKAPEPGTPVSLPATVDNLHYVSA